MLESRGFALQGRFSERSQDTDGDATTVEWASRRLLARMHSYSRAQRRRRYEPASAEQLMRFLVQWHHVNGATQLRGPEGVRSEEHTSELQSLMRISYAVCGLKQKKKKTRNRDNNRHILHTNS